MGGGRECLVVVLRRLRGVTLLLVRAGEQPEDETVLKVRLLQLGDRGIGIPRFERDVAEQ